MYSLLAGVTECKNVYNLYYLFRIISRYRCYYITVKQCLRSGSKKATWSHPRVDRSVDETSCLGQPRSKLWGLFLKATNTPLASILPSDQNSLKKSVILCPSCSQMVAKRVSYNAEEHVYSRGFDHTTKLLQRGLLVPLRYLNGDPVRHRGPLPVEALPTGQHTSYCTMQITFSEFFRLKGITQPCSTAYWAQFLERIHIKVPQNATIQKP